MSYNSKNGYDATINTNIVLLTLSNVKKHLKRALFPINQGLLQGPW